MRPTRRALDALEAAGHPVLRLSTRIAGLGAEFFRWEFATAVAGAVLGINPFDEPNVSEAKEKTKALLAAVAARARCRQPGAVAAAGGIAVFSPTLRGASPGAVVAAALASLGPRDYVAFLSYLPADERRREQPSRTIRNGDPRAPPRRDARSASDRAICTRPGSTTRAGRTRPSRS